MVGERARRGGVGCRYAAFALWAFLCTFQGILWSIDAAGAGDVRPLEIDVQESIDLGDVLVMGAGQLEVEMATDGQRTSPAGPTAFGSLPFGSGRLRLLGEPGACVRLTANPFGRWGSGRWDGGHLEVRRVRLRVGHTVGREDIELRLDAHGLATVEVGVQVRLHDVRRSQQWRLELSFEARYGEECLP